MLKAENSEFVEKKDTQEGGCFVEPGEDRVEVQDNTTSDLKMSEVDEQKSSSSVGDEDVDEKCVQFTAKWHGKQFDLELPASSTVLQLKESLSELTVRSK